MNFCVQAELCGWMSIRLVFHEYATCQGKENKDDLIYIIFYWLKKKGCISDSSAERNKLWQLKVVSIQHVRFKKCKDEFIPRLHTYTIVNKLYTGSTIHLGDGKYIVCFSGMSASDKYKPRILFVRLPITYANWLHVKLLFERVH